MKKICSEANYHLRNISKILKYLTQDSAQILIHAIVSQSLTTVTHFSIVFHAWEGQGLSWNPINWRRNRRRFKSFLFVSFLFFFPVGLEMLCFAI